MSKDNYLWKLFKLPEDLKDSYDGRKISKAIVEYIKIATNNDIELIDSILTCVSFFTQCEEFNISKDKIDEVYNSMPKGLKKHIKGIYKYIESELK